MAASQFAFRFAVSEQLFRLTTEGIRLHSNEVGALSSLSQLVRARRGILPDTLPRHGDAVLREHFITVPSEGTIELRCRLSEADVDCISGAQAWLHTALSKEASVSDALSALLFDYAVERAATRMLENVGFSGAEGDLPMDDSTTAKFHGRNK